MRPGLLLGLGRVVGKLLLRPGLLLGLGREGVGLLLRYRLLLLLLVLPRRVL